MIRIYSVAMLMALLLDLANIVGGFLLALGLLVRLPRVGAELGRAGARLNPVRWVVGVLALVAAGFWIIVHTFSGPHLFHFEIVGLGVGIALLWDRLTGRTGAPRESVAPAGGTTVTDTATGVHLLLAVFGLIAIAVGVQGLFTPN
jgi:hypothetical protein